MNLSQHKHSRQDYLTEERAERDRLREEFVNLRAWLTYWKDRTISQQSHDHRGHVTNSWAACPIPDWDVKQKLELIDAALHPTPGPDQAKGEGELNDGKST